MGDELLGPAGDEARVVAQVAPPQAARLLAEPERPLEAEPLVGEARTAYAGMGASGWLAMLEAWHAGTLAVRTP